MGPNLEDDIELAWYMRYILNLDYMEGFTPGNRMPFANDDGSTTVRVPYTRSPSDKYYASHKNIKYDDAGAKIAERIEELFDKKFKKRFFKESRWHDVGSDEVTRETLKRAERVLASLQKDTATQIEDHIGIIRSKKPR
ncbi:hypothetical protein [Tautonia plasticadhaerens]|uniref:hypothetical protein n=1 Tax=Tautonia plasticadhaerens TaxID=2527974 RepID=UPI00119D0FF6|nr:hypothetical protein [Tautonia plasticadhaerens]